MNGRGIRRIIRDSGRLPATQLGMLVAEASGLFITKKREIFRKCDMLKGHGYKIISNLHCLQGVNSGGESCWYRLTHDAEEVTLFIEEEKNSLKKNFLEMVFIWFYEEMRPINCKKTFGNTFLVP